MLKPQLLKEKNRLAEQLTIFQEEKNKIIASAQNAADSGSTQYKIREINQKILELQEEIKAVDLKLK